MELQDKPEPADQMLDKIEQAAKVLGEHFLCVQIIAVLADDEDGHETLGAGYGPFQARYGSIKEWLLDREEEMKERARKTDDE